MTAETYPNILLALCIWREARNQSRDARVGVKHVIMNRAARPAGPYRRCKTIQQNILQGAYPSKLPAQFSSFNHSDPNSSLLPNEDYAADWAAWLDCCAIVDEIEPDPTGGATYYFDTNIPAPRWADPKQFTVQIGKLRFYAL